MDYCYFLVLCSRHAEKKPINQLRNGWTVDESWIVREIGVNAGAYFERQADRGDTHAYARMVVWADGLSRAEATPYMIIKGPRGTFPR